MFNNFQCLRFHYTHTLGSNSTTTLGPSVVELITFAALSWTFTVSVIILVVLHWDGVHHGISCKMSIKNYVLTLDLEFYSQAM